MNKIDSEAATAIDLYMDPDAEQDIDMTLELDMYQDDEEYVGPGASLDDMVAVEPNVELDIIRGAALAAEQEAEHEEGSDLEDGIELDAELDGEPVPELVEKLKKQLQAEPEELQLTEEELALLLAKRKKRQRTLVLVAVIAWVCVGVTFMYANGIGPFGEKEERTYLEPDIPFTEGEAIPVMWVTAGEGYKNLFKLIREQTSGLRSSTKPEDDIDEADPSLPQGPDAPMDALGIEPYTDAPPGETAVAGSGYEQAPLLPDGQGWEPDGDGGADSGYGGDHENAGGDGDHANTESLAASMRRADVVQTDGKYIYAINSNNLIIAKVDGDSMEFVARIPQPAEKEGQVYFEMYVAGDRLIAIRHGYNPVALSNLPAGQADVAGIAEFETCIDYPIGGYILDTSIDIYDIGDRAEPFKLHTLTQSGEYYNSRIIDGYLYLITTYYGNVMQMSGDDPRTFIPLFARDGEQFMPDEKDIYLPPGTVWPCYTVVSGIDVAGSGAFISQKCVYGDPGTIYVSPGAVYLAHTTWGEDTKDAGDIYVATSYWSETVLTKLTIKSGGIEPGAQTRVPGYILNQFSLDEYDGVLRLVVTVDNSFWYGFKDNSEVYTDEEWASLPKGESSTANALYTLGPDLTMLGSIDKLAPGERVYSCRFMGKTCYCITFRQVEPLFSVDIGDPTAPRVMGSLKLPGVAEYLYPYKAGRFFGLGRDLDPETGARSGLRLTMYDNSDPSAVKEHHSLVVEGEYSTVEYNLKAILVNAEKSLVAFPINDTYFIYGYDETKGFEKIAEVKFGGSESDRDGIRGLFIGATFYVVGHNDIGAYSISAGAEAEAFARIGSLNVDSGAGPVNRWNIGGANGKARPPVPLDDAETPRAAEAPGDAETPDDAEAPDDAETPGDAP